MDTFFVIVVFLLCLLCLAYMLYSFAGCSVFLEHYIAYLTLRGMNLWFLKEGAVYYL